MSARLLSRVEAIDIARGIAVFFIPMAHVLLLYGSTSTQEESWLGIIGHFFGKWAGVFLIAMGFSYTLSKRNTITSSIQRGAYILLIGYVMNFLKFVPLIVLGLLPENFVKAYGWSLPLNANHILYMVLIGDILQLTGLCLCFMGIIHTYAKKHKELTILLVVCILVLTNYVRGYHTGVGGVDYLLDILWGKDWNVYFPVFPWFGFILTGMFFGYVYNEHDKNIKETFHKIIRYGSIVALIGVWLCYDNYELHMNDYFHLGVGGFLFLLGINLVFFWLAQQLYENLKLGKVMAVLQYCSRNITSMYVIQWVLICWGMAVLGYKNKTPYEVLIWGITFTGATLGIQKLIETIQFKKIIRQLFGIITVTYKKMLTKVNKRKSRSTIGF